LEGLSCDDFLPLTPSEGGRKEPPPKGEENKSHFGGVIL